MLAPRGAWGVRSGTSPARYQCDRPSRLLLWPALADSLRGALFSHYSYGQAVRLRAAGYVCDVRRFWRPYKPARSRKFLSALPGVTKTRHLSLPKSSFSFGVFGIAGGQSLGGGPRALDQLWKLFELALAHTHTATATHPHPRRITLFPTYLSPWPQLPADLRDGKCRQVAIVSWKHANTGNGSWPVVPVVPVGPQKEQSTLVITARICHLYGPK
jgi:hypothetical protein